MGSIITIGRRQEEGILKCGEHESGGKRAGSKRPTHSLPTHLWLCPSPALYLSKTPPPFQLPTVPIPPQISALANLDQHNSLHPRACGSVLVSPPLWVVQSCLMAHLLLPLGLHKGLVPAHPFLRVVSNSNNFIDCRNNFSEEVIWEFSWNVWSASAQLRYKEWTL